MRAKGVMDFGSKDFRNCGGSKMTSEWLDIETAPKDGTRIIIGKAAGYVMAWASSAYWFNREPCPCKPPKCKPGTHQGWTDGCDTLGTPTHWMPLPEPPEKELDR